MLELTFLGTSSGMPTKYRNVSGLAMVCVNKYLSKDRQASKQNRPWILIDCGEGTQHQLLHTKLSLHQLQVICITHVHGDHCYGLPGLLSSMAMSGRKRALTIIAPQKIEKLLQVLMSTTELFLPFALNFLAVEDILDKQNRQIALSFTPTHTMQIKVTPLSHRVPSYAFTLTQIISRITLNKEKLLADGIMPSPVWGRLQQAEDVKLADGRQIHYEDYVAKETQQVKVVVAGDNDNPELLVDEVKQASLLVHESTHTQAVADKIHARADGYNPQHTTVKQIAQFAQKHNVANLILTHFSARYMPFDKVNEEADKKVANKMTNKVANMGHVRTEVEQNFTGAYQQRFWLAKDFDVFRVDEMSVCAVEQPV